MRRIFVYAAVTNDEDNEADGLFQQPVREVAMLNVAIYGASGYTGFELLRILASHGGVAVVAATSRQYKGKAVDEAFPSLRGFYPGLAFSDPEDFKTIKADAAFSALPHGASQEVVPELLKTSRVIDLSADFRLSDAAVYRAWYGEHKSEGLLKEAVYGLPELHREKIKGAKLIANPGCYPTSAILALAPAVKAGLIDAPRGIIVDSKSGVSGAGRGAALETSFVEVASGFKAYKVGCHRHAPEIAQEVSGMAGLQVCVTFTPHLIPVSRGILTTVYAPLKDGMDIAELHSVYDDFFSKEPFVRVLPAGKFPDISFVRGSNLCDIGVWADKERKQAVLVSAIDNLVKG
ncbi:MAG: N-acetyl-gamma-glutamyl-phosphate reductase, partial [Deltaproteobacteria bacterium]|nr:N-acetyl-gamma-glutamyl-phosphate reductase [Deltaproteobacteria bacterium]